MVPTMIVLLIAPAYSQKRGMPPPKEDPQERRIEQERKELERQHKATMDRIPDQKKNTDPWHDVRGTNPVKKKSD
jgi:hypothetical protein